MSNAKIATGAAIVALSLGLLGTGAIPASAGYYGDDGQYYGYDTGGVGIGVDPGGIYINHRRPHHWRPAHPPGPDWCWRWSYHRERWVWTCDFPFWMWQRDPYQDWHHWHPGWRPHHEHHDDGDQGDRPPHNWHPKGGDWQNDDNGPPQGDWKKKRHDEGDDSGNY